MPIYLPPISRRRFLQRALAASSVLALSPKAVFGAKEVAADSWALLSDLHIAADRGAVARGINMTEHLEIVSKELLALEKCPAGVFITGDCAFNSGEVTDYGTLAKLLVPVRA